MLPLGLLIGWLMVSPLWAADKFAAVVSGAHVASALVFLASTGQLVRTWGRLRIVAAATLGIFFLLLLHGLWWWRIDLPELRDFAHEHTEQMLRSLNKEPGSRDAEQLQKNVESGAPTGFSVSTNTYAALLVLLGVTSFGVAMQRRADGEGWAWVMPVVGSFPLFAILIRLTQSKAAYLTPVIGAAALWGLAHFGARLAQLGRRAYFMGVGLFLLGIAAVVGHGIAHGTLPTDSMAFRWNYWVASARLFKAHPFIGVGWDNFGAQYLAYRLPVAPEEIRDPHNFLVRAFVELGIVGGGFLVAWLARWVWEVTQHKTKPTSGAGTADSLASPGKREALPLLTLAAAGMLLSVLISFDWQAQSAFLVFEGIKRVVFGVGLAGGLLLGAMRAGGACLERRDCPWVFRAMCVALALFMAHNLVDFSLFEPGPMTVVALLAGAVWGVSLRDPAATSVQRRRRWTEYATLAAGAIGWLVIAAAVVIPVAAAEGDAQNGHEEFRMAVELSRAGTPEARNAAADHAAIAARDYHDAGSVVRYNADYAFQEAQADEMTRDPGSARPALDRAIAVDPSSATYRLARARLYTDILLPVIASRATTPSLIAQKSEAQALVRNDFDAALRLDPNNVEARLAFAKALEQFGDAKAAAGQYEKALWYNAQLSKEENKRLPEARVAEITRRLTRFRTGEPL